MVKEIAEDGIWTTIRVILIVIPMYALILSGLAFYNDVGCSLADKIGAEHKIEDFSKYDSLRKCEGGLE